MSSRSRWRPKGLRYIPLAVLAAAVWLSGNASASATMPFTPSFDVMVSNANPGASANATTVHSVPGGNHLIDSINIFIPIQWQMSSGTTYPVGETVGQVMVKADEGCDGSVETLTAGSLINQALGPDPNHAEWKAIVDGSWQMLFIVEQTSQPREWQISVTLNNGTMPANLCSPQEVKLTIFGRSSPTDAGVIANPAQAGDYTWDDGLLSLGGSHVEFVGDSVVIGTDTDADGWADTVDADDDNDTWSDLAEGIIDTDPLDNCADGPNDAANPGDINNDMFFDITDLSALTGVFGEAVPTAPPRYDIAPDPPDGFVDITDISRLTGLFGQGCV